MAIFGELSLAGEIRNVVKSKQRIKAAENLGFTKVLSPEEDCKQDQICDIKQLVKKVFA